MATHDFEIGLNLHKEFSMVALVDNHGACLRYDRLDNIPEYLEHYFSQLKGSFRVAFEFSRNWY